MPCSWFERINIVNMSILLKAMYRYNVIPIKMPMVFFYRTRTKNPEICIEPQKTPNSQAILRKKNKAGGLKFQISIYTTKYQTSMGLA